MKRSKAASIVHCPIRFRAADSRRAKAGRGKVAGLFAAALAWFSILVLVNTGEVLALSGGPDYFGYTFADSNSEKGPRYAWIEIRDTGTEILANSDDAYVNGIPIGFPFEFYGVSHTTMSVTSNGLALTSPGTGQFSNQPIGASSPHNFIAPFWDDLVTWDPAGAVYYITLGEAPRRTFVVEWYDVQRFAGTPSGGTFEVILFEGSNDIKFQYRDVDFGATSANNGAGATVGIEGPTGQGLQYSYNQPSLSAGLAILFKYPGSFRQVPQPSPKR